MASRLGRHAQRLSQVRALRTVKGRRAARRFVFEGETLLGEARAARCPIEELYATQAAYDAVPALRELEETGTPTFIVDPAAAASISDLTTPSGIAAIAPFRLMAVDELVRCGSPLLVLADVNDPANVGTLLRSAEAFGCPRVVFGSLGLDPYHPKVVRGSMGAVFRLALAVSDAEAIGRAASAAGVRLLGLATEGSSLIADSWEPPLGLVVGNERHGLGRWADHCDGLVAIPMTGRAESLSAGVAGSIALYEAQRAALVKGVV
ncbi:MAG: RNA methyltransferase [Candidatus Eremiobacteraeota bacterium]|nr:RNA methyltransferase [Candidatus Eremiobacteraeota bacterium]